MKYCKCKQPTNSFFRLGGEIVKMEQDWVFVNPMNKQWYSKEELESTISQTKQELIEEIKKIVYGIYTDETEGGYHEDIDLNKAHNASLDILITRLNNLSNKLENHK